MGSIRIPCSSCGDSAERPGSLQNLQNGAQISHCIQQNSQWIHIWRQQPEMTAFSPPYAHQAITRFALGTSSAPALIKYAGMTDTLTPSGGCGTGCSASGPGWCTESGPQSRTMQGFTRAWKSQTHNHLRMFTLSGRKAIAPADSQKPNRE